jgi:hypothetical protein
MERQRRFRFIFHLDCLTSRGFIPCTTFLENFLEGWELGLEWDRDKLYNNNVS